MDKTYTIVALWGLNAPKNLNGGVKMIKYNNIAQMEKEKQIKEIFQELKHYKLELIFKNGPNSFYIKNKQGKIISLLRSFSDSNFNPASEFYGNAESKINKIKSDYNYVLNLRRDC